MRQVKDFSGNGFTLLEIIVVMVLISIMTAFAVPTLRSSLFSDQLSSSARKLIGLITETSQEAVRTRQAYRLVFDREVHAFMVKPVGQVQETGWESVVQRQLPLPAAVQVVDVSSVHGGKRALGELAILFNSRGYVDRTSIHLRHDDGRDMTVMLSPFLGTTRVYDSYVDLEDEALY